MARDGAGNYNLVSGNPVSTSTIISSTWANTTLADLAAAMTQSVSKDGQTVITGNLQMGSNKLTGLGNATLRTDSIPAGQVQDNTTHTLSSVGGTAAAITAGLTPTITAYVAGMIFSFLPANNSVAGGTTLNISAIGAITILKKQLVPLAANDLQSNVQAIVVYDGTHFLLINPQTNVENILGTVAGLNTITAATPALTTYSQGQIFSFTPAGTNIAGGVTLNIAGLGAKNVLKFGGVALVAGDLAAAFNANVVYDGNEFYLLNPGVAVSTSANPSAVIGLAAVNGSALTFLTSDSAPALSQAIVPTWTGKHIFSASAITFNGNLTQFNNLVGSGVALSGADVGGAGVGYNVSFNDSSAGVIRGYIGIGQTTIVGAGVADFCITSGSGGRTVIGIANGAAIGTSFGAHGEVIIAAPTLAGAVALTVTAISGQEAMAITAPNSAGNSFGFNINAGTNSSDFCFNASGAAGTNYFQINGAGKILGNGPVAAALLDMTPDTGTFTITYTGFATPPTGTAVWTRIGNLVFLTIPAATGTSNTTAMTATGLPAAIQPVRSCGGMVYAENNSLPGTAVFASLANGSGTITFVYPAGSTFTSTGTKGISNASTICYPIN